jgi:pyrroline-5-carboxylate reductase
MTPTIAFIGGGNMARSLIGGLIAHGTPATHLRVAEPVATLREALIHDFGVAAFADGAQAAADADVWVLAVKPQVMRSVCTQLAATAQARRPLVISIAAGITHTQLERWLGGALAVVRAMPNTPALLGAGVTGLYAGEAVRADQRALADTLLSAVGNTVWVEEEALMDAVTAVSGSGPAYLFLLAEAMLDAAMTEGLPASAARLLVQQTLLGAARMLTESDAEAAELRRRVTSPGGTTQAAIDTFEAGGFRPLVAAAIHAARVRGAELSAAYDE